MGATPSSVNDYKVSEIPQPAPTPAERDSFYANTRDRKISLPTLEGINFERIKDIVSVEAQGNYANFSFCDGRHLLVCRTLRDIEEMIENKRQFIRVHRSFIINLDYLRKYIRGKGGAVVMENGANISVSVGKKQAFMDALQLYFG